MAAFFLYVIWFALQTFLLELNISGLSKIKSPEDLKALSQEEIKNLAEEIRKIIIEVVGNNGGHLASNLGVVELSIALHRVFESPKDAIVWDVSHQCYAHKILTGRYEKFSTLRQKDGLSGFTKKAESPHDFFDAGHSSTSISSALGLITAWNLEGRDGHVVAVIGDGALTGGLALEALSNAAQISKKLIVIVNDNQMSIDKNTGAISRYLSKLTVTSHYQKFRNIFDKALSKIPFFSNFLAKVVFRFKRSLKAFIFSNNLFSDLGFEYAGPYDGHNEKALEKVMRHAKKMNCPVVIHIVTKKGKGYSPAENNPEKFHGIGPFCTSDGTVEKFDTESFTNAFSNALMKISERRKDIVCITAAMAKGTGLAAFSRHYPERFFDVGIAEEHAVTFAGGLSAGGLLPIVCIYSTFIQRSVDQMIHDISLQKAHVIFILDRAGAVPNDGETHQGIFDIALFRPIPNIQILSPVSAKDLELMLEYAAEKSEESVVIRYSKNSCPSELEQFSYPLEIGRGIFLKSKDYAIALEGQLSPCDCRKKVLFVTTGGMYPEVLVSCRSLLMKDFECDIYIMRFIKPFDEDFFCDLIKDYCGIVFVEDGVALGGIGEYLQGLVAMKGFRNTVLKAFPQKYPKHGSREQVLFESGLSSLQLEEAALSLFEK